MEQYKGNTPLEPGRDSDFQRLVRQRKQVPVNTAVILLNILVFLLVEITGTSLNAQHMVDYGASYTPISIRDTSITDWSHPCSFILESSIWATICWCCFLWETV